MFGMCINLVLVGMISEHYCHEMLMILCLYILTMMLVQCWYQGSSCNSRKKLLCFLELTFAYFGYSVRIVPTFHSNVTFVLCIWRFECSSHFPSLFLSFHLFLECRNVDSLIRSPITDFDSVRLV